MKTPENYITEWFDNIVLPNEPSGLYQPIVYALGTGGKRLRPTLLLFALMAFGGDPLTAKNQCLGIELFHNFTLLHDDVMDNSPMRRGRPTVHCQWNENTAILSGDAMLTLSGQFMADCDDRHLRKILDLFNRTAIQVYEGQQLDMDFESRDDVVIDEYMEMIRLKTSVLLACALKTGAILGGASEDDSDAMYRFGINLGLGFQLRDDYLDTFGNAETFGKKVGGDILNDKKTWLMIRATETNSTKNLITSVLKSNLPDKEKIERVRDCYRSLSLDTEILKLIAQYSEKAIDNLAYVNMDESMRHYFTELALQMADRSR